MIKTYASASDIDFSVEELSSLPHPGRVLMTKPTFFDVKYAINPYMADYVGDVDRQEADRQWHVLRDAYESLGFTVNLIEGRDDLVDMVFCANQTLPFYSPKDGEHGVVMSSMHAPQRRGEVEHFEHFFRSIGYDIFHIRGDGVLDFEGMGDAIWHPRTHLLWGGYGIRTSREAYNQISERLDVRVLLLRLDDDAFYHLDTCFSALDESSVLIFPGAFDEIGLGLIHHMFERVIEAPEDESRRLFACNCHCPDGERVIIQMGCDVTNRLLRDAGFEPIEVDTGEFLKAGGSVFCMKQMFW